MREERGATQTELTGHLGTSQANVSQLEARPDIYLSTLGHYIAALGGPLQVVAIFPDETIELAITPDEEPGVAPA